jgi:hypothetical protein
MTELNKIVKKESRDRPRQDEDPHELYPTEE